MRTSLNARFEPISTLLIGMLLFFFTTGFALIIFSSYITNQQRDAQAILDLTKIFLMKQPHPLRLQQVAQTIGPHRVSRSLFITLVDDTYLVTFISGQQRMRSKLPTVLMRPQDDSFIRPILNRRLSGSIIRLLLTM